MVSYLLIKIHFRVLYLSATLECFQKGKLA